MVNYKILTLSFIFSLGVYGSIYTINESNNIDLCIRGLSCEDTQFINEFKNYSFTEEGKVFYIKDSIEEDIKIMLTSVAKVIKVSRDNYKEVLDVASSGEDFNEIYHLNLKFFNKKYTLLLDKASPTNEYVQNIGEIVLNGYKGDCDDYALMLYLIAKEKGLEVRYVVGVNHPDAHAWIQIKINEKWIEYDSTSDRICEGCISEDYILIDYLEEVGNEL